MVHRCSLENSKVEVGPCQTEQKQLAPARQVSPDVSLLIHAYSCKETKSGKSNFIAKKCLLHAVVNFYRMAIRLRSPDRGDVNLSCFHCSFSSVQKSIGRFPHGAHDDNGSVRKCLASNRKWSQRDPFWKWFATCVSSKPSALCQHTVVIARPLQRMCHQTSSPKADEVCSLPQLKQVLCKSLFFVKSHDSRTKLLR